MCLYPRLIRNRKYTKTKKNGGNIPPVTDKRVLMVPVGCQKCIECRKQKTRGWQIRLHEDIKEHRNGKMVTLTFSNESIAKLYERSSKILGYELDNEIATIAVRLFLERWRKKYKKSLRHFLITELGHNGTENVHLHGIVWTDKPLEEIEAIWGYGYVWKGKEQLGKLINYVSERTVNYIVKYITKTDPKHPGYNPKILTSPGIGRHYMNRVDWQNNKFNGTKTIETYRTNTGHKISLPIYWRNKIYSEEEREKLWLQRLDKEERWVCGERVKISNGEQDYYRVLKFYRERNIKMGYGSDEDNWERKEYEKQRRMLKQKERIKKGQEILEKLFGVTKTTIRGCRPEPRG